MGGHVPSVGKNRHRSEHDAADDFAAHHGRRQRHHQPDPSLVAGMPLTEENVIVGPLVNGMRMHERSSDAGGSAYPGYMRGRTASSKPDALWNWAPLFRGGAMGPQLLERNGGQPVGQHFQVGRAQAAPRRMLVTETAHV